MPAFLPPEPSPALGLLGLCRAFEASLSAFETVATLREEARLRHLLVSRRRAVARLRRLLGLRGPVARRPPREAWTLGGMIAAEWELAHLVVAAAAALAADDPARELLGDLQAEVEEAALTLRVIERADGGPPGRCV